MTKTTAENSPYKRGPGSGLKTGGKAAYTPSSSVDEHSYGVSTGKANAQGGSVPSVQIGGSFEVGVVPAMPGTLRVGVDKNVSTPVSGS